VEAELARIWIHIARLTERFWLLARYPYRGRRRDDDLHPVRACLAADDYVIIHRIVEHRVVLILHVVHSSRAIAALFGH